MKLAVGVEPAVQPGWRGRPGSRKHLTSAELAANKNKFPCHESEIFGHWASDHGPDGNLKPEVVAFNTAAEALANAIRNNKTKGSARSGNNNVALGSNSFISPPDATLHCNTTGVAYMEVSAGPLVSDVVQFSAIGQTELKLLMDESKSCDFEIEPKLQGLEEYEYWQYVSDAHANPKRRILGSVQLYVRTDNGYRISICHLVVEGASQWIIGQKLATKSNLEYIDRNAIKLPNIQPTNYVQVYSHDMRSHISLDRFTNIDDEACKSVSPRPAQLAATACYQPRRYEQTRKAGQR